jgi:hypothetical protein
VGLLQLISPVNSSLTRGSHTNSSHTNTELDGINDKAAQNSAIWQQCVPYTGLLAQRYLFSHTQRNATPPSPPPPPAGPGGVDGKSEFAAQYNK